jgi:hypothetical protein
VVILPLTAHSLVAAVGARLPSYFFVVLHLSSGDVQHEGFVEIEENGDESADIFCDDDLEREEITAALADAENQADTCMREEEETEIADGDT